MQTTKVSEKNWYVLRDLSRPNAKTPAYKMLQEMPAFRNNVFVPMKQHVSTKCGKHVVNLVPYITDLLFVHSCREILDPIISEIPTLQYRYVRGGYQHQAMIVGESAMNDFIKAVEQIDLVQYYRPEDVSARFFGKKIRIIGGHLNGFTGRLMSQRGSKVKRLIIDLEECQLSAAIQVQPEYIQLIK